MKGKIAHKNIQKVIENSIIVGIKNIITSNPKLVIKRR
jgi:hypothetical protein